MKTFLQRLFKRENYIALLLVVASLISVFEIPQHFGVSETKLILIMMGFLAIDALIEKIGYLDELETRVRRIERIVIPNPNTVLLQSRGSLTPFSERIAGTKHVFVSAISANSLVTQNYRAIQSALKAGTNFRFVLVSTDSPAIPTVTFTSPTSTDVETQIRWIQDSIEMLRKLAQTEGKGRIELRLCQGVPASSIIACDVDRDDGWIQVELHAYRQTPANRPLFMLQVADKSEWFEFYRKVVEELWSEGQTVSL